MFNRVVNTSLKVIKENSEKKLGHCIKSVRIRSLSGPYFPVFRLNMERYGISLRIQSECGKIRTKKTPNKDTFHAVADNCIIDKILGEYLFFASNIYMC